MRASLGVAVQKDALSRAVADYRSVGYLGITMDTNVAFYQSGNRLAAPATTRFH